MILCHDYCSDIESAVYLDAIRMELINETNSIRKRAYLLPREAMVHKLPLPKYGEHTLAAYSEEAHDAGQNDLKDWEFWNTENKKITEFWKLPDFYECCTLNMQLDEF